MSKNANWFDLDNAAKMIPSTMIGSDTRVFRITCELKEEVDPVVLQEALDHTLREFPHFNSRLKKGMFWHYLERSKERPLVEPETKVPLAAIYSPGSRNIMFRVLYFRKRFHLEVFHALADGTGGFMFMEHLILHYISLKHQLEIPLEVEDPATVSQRMADAFSFFYRRDGKKRVKVPMPRWAFHLKGERYPDQRLQLIEAIVSSKDFLRLARQYHTTVGVLAVSLLIEAIVKEVPVRKKNLPVVLQIPVNLRNYFPHNTTRNFFGVMEVAYLPVRYDGTLESILEPTARSFSLQLDKAELEKTMNSYTSVERNWAARMVPLLLKEWGIHGLYYLHQWGLTSSVSNLGRIRLPEEAERYIENISCFMASRDMQICFCTYQEKMTFGCVSAFRRNQVLTNLFRRMGELGLDVTIISSDYEKEEGPAHAEM